MPTTRAAPTLSLSISAPTDPAPVSLTLTVNGERHHLDIDPRLTLLNLLREELGLTGTKLGCDHGQCGACTVHSDGRRVLACLTLAFTQDGAEVRTVEGLATGDHLHPMQQAFIDCDAFQCGFCTPGQLMSAVAVLSDGERQAPSLVTPDLATAPAPGELAAAELRERMSGNLCRCGAYPHIIAAIEQVQASPASNPSRLGEGR